MTGAINRAAVHCCDDCTRRAGLVPKYPADSGVSSWLCRVCGHYGIGSRMDCERGEWGHLRPIRPSNAR